MSSSSSSSSSSLSSLSGCTSSSSSSFFLSSTPTYRVHSLVVFSILDHYQRRNDNQTRVVGTLLGSIGEGNVIEVKRAFPVPHEEEDESATVQIDYHTSMLALYKQVSPNDVVVGWYSTTGFNEADAAQSKASAPRSSKAQRNYVTSLMHEVYRTQMSGNGAGSASSGLEPLHLTVDVSMRGGMKVAGYTNSVTRARSSTGVGADVLACFQPVRLSLNSYAEEKIGIDALINSIPDDDAHLDAPATFLTDAENIEGAVSKVLESIVQLEEYIARVVDGKESHPNAQLALDIHALLSSLPTLADAHTFTTTFATHIQDLLAIVYLANMTKNQLAIADKANMLM